MNHVNQTNLNQKAAKLAALLTLTCLLAAHPEAAANDTWNGGAVPDGNWLTPGNWNGVAPATNDLLIFTGNTQTATTNNYPAGTPFNNITFNSAASAFTLNGNTLTLSEPSDAGSGQIANGSINSASTSTETIRLPIVLATGNHKINNTGSGTLKLNGLITHSNGAVVTMSGNINVTGGLSTNGSANGILGGWAIYNHSGSFDWATLDANSNVVAYASYTDVAPAGTIADNAGSNVRIPTAGGAINITAGTTHINSLLVSAGTAAQTVNVGAGNKLVLGQNGGIYNSSSVASGGTYRQLTLGASLAQGGILTAGDGINPAQITFGSPPLASGSQGFLFVHSVITDNGPAPVTVTVAGAYCQFDGNGAGATTNTYSGGTYILQGRVSQPGSHTFGTGPIYVYPGGQFNTGCQITNDVYLEGTGTTENNGMGAVRIYAANLGGGVLGNLCGTVHLIGDAALGGNNNLNAGGQPFNGVSGKITGKGGLIITSPTATSTGAGTVSIGSTNGAPGTIFTNDYAGDTTINAMVGTGGSGTGNTLNTTLRICLPVDSNIMPHGTNGSYAGGKTGNLILNANLISGNNLLAVFDLNGSTQTINGLSSTPRSPANNLIVDNGAGNGTLIVGDSDATSTFGGIIQNSISLNKIGNGTLTLSGANLYTGDTIIKAGKLVTSTASTGGGNYSVSNNAALGVTVATPGTTLSINNLTFGSSATSLQLNAGTSGNPTGPLVYVPGALTMNGNVDISLSGVGLTAGGPFTVLTYNAGSRTGPGSFVLNNSPRVVATLNDDHAGTVTMTIISADSGIRWNGGTSGNWDISNAGNTIWRTFPSGSTSYYIEASGGNDSVIFDDLLTGTNTVNLTTALTPQSVTFSNSSVNYLFSGTGKITGATGLTKNGTGSLTIANSGNNDFSGPIALNAGTLIISNNSTIGNAISGTGALTKTGNSTLTLSGDGSAYAGPVTVNGGTLTVLNTLSLATATGITVTNGGALDIGLNSVNLGHVPITVSGSGVAGNGAIVNSSGYSAAAVANSFQNLTLAGDTTIGGPGRLDFRATTAASDTDAQLLTSGQSYKLTKTSISTLQMAGVQIDNALGDIDVQQGTLSFQGFMPSLGNPANALTVFGGATLQFNSVKYDLNKVLIVKDNGNINNLADVNIYDGAVTLQGNGLFNITAGSLTFTNVISGPGTLSKITGLGTLTLTASNTYTGDTIINTGTLALSEPGSITTSRSINLASGTSILDVSGRSDQSLTLHGGQTLSGFGTVNGSLTNLPGATIAPGTPLAAGTLIVNGGAVLSGTNVAKLVETNLTCDLLIAANGPLQLGGTLVVSTLVGPLKNGDVFQLFAAAGGFTGNFANLVPATPGPNFAWDTTSLATAGQLGVIYNGNMTPTNIVTSFDGSNLTLSWPADHIGWQLQVQTNNLSTGLSSNWVNVPNSSSTNLVIIPVTSSGSVFYRMVSP